MKAKRTNRRKDRVKMAEDNIRRNSTGEPTSKQLGLVILRSIVGIVLAILMGMVRLLQKVASKRRG